MIILDQYTVCKIEAMVCTAPGSNRVFFQNPQPRSCFTGIGNPGRIGLNLINKPGCKCCNAGQPLEQIKGYSFSFQQINDRATDREQDSLGGYMCAIGNRTNCGNRGIKCFD